MLHGQQKKKKKKGVLKLISLVCRHNESSGVGGILFDGQILRVAAAGVGLLLSFFTTFAECG